MKRAPPISPPIILHGRLSNTFGTGKHGSTRKHQQIQATLRQPITTLPGAQSRPNYLPEPLPKPFCKRPKQVPPFPVRRSVSNPLPHALVRQESSIVRSQYIENRLRQTLSDDRDSKSMYAPRYRPVKIESVPKSLGRLPRSPEFPKFHKTKSHGQILLIQYLSLRQKSFLILYSSTARARPRVINLSRLARSTASLNHDPLR